MPISLNGISTMLPSPKTTSSPQTYTSTPGHPKRLSDYEPLAKICSAFVLELFAPESFEDTFDSLPYFIAMAFSQSQLPEANALAALTLLHRLKAQQPARCLSSPVKCREAERLFLSSYIAATKVLSDDRYRLQFWVVVGQNKFSVDELTQMEKDFFEGLAWDVRIDDATLAIYQLLVERQKQVEGMKEHENQISRSSSTDSDASTESSGSTTSSNWGSLSSGSSPSPTVPSTPADFTISDPVVAAGLRMKESEQNMASLNQRIEELQQKLDSMLYSGSCRGETHSPKSHSTRHAIKERLRHVFHC